MKTHKSVEEITIAIPTKNRQQNLCTVLERLVNEELWPSEVLILNNGARLGSQIYEMASESGFPIRIIENDYDCGLSENCMRCFDATKTKWLYLLGDSKLPCKDFMTILYEGITDHPEALFLNFPGVDNLLNKRPTRTAIGTDSFLGEMDSFGNTILVGASVYNIPKLRQFFHYGYTFGLTYAPYFAMLLPALGKDEQAVFHSTQILERALEQPPGSQWDTRAVNLGLALLTQLPISEGAKHTLATKLEDEKFGSSSFRRLLRWNLAAVVAGNQPRHQAREWLKLLLTARYWCKKRNILALRKLALDLIFFSPKMTWYSYRLLEISARSIGSLARGSNTTNEIEKTGQK